MSSYDKEKQAQFAIYNDHTAFLLQRELRRCMKGFLLPPSHLKRLLHCIYSQRDLGQTITLPFQMSWETDMLGLCANSPLFPSAAPVSHPGDSGELHEHHLLRGEAPLLKQSPPDCYSAAIWYTSVCVLSQNKDAEL